MDQRIIALYEGFTHGHINRRNFFERLTELAGSAAAATALLPLLKNDYARAAIVAPDDARLAAETISFDAAGTKLSGYLVRRKEKGKRPAVIVIHENRGLNPHIRDVTRRVALEGFLALGIDLLSPLGGTPEDEDKGREMIGKLNLAETTKQLVDTVAFLEKHPESTGKVGAVGFCWGGGMVDRLAIASPDLKAAVSYYGPVPPLDHVANIRAPLLLHYAGLDTFVNPKIPSFEEALKAHGKNYTLYMYEGVNHAFNNDTAGPRYNKEAADLAWRRTIAFFEEYLGKPPRA